MLILAAFVAFLIYMFNYHLDIAPVFFPVIVWVCLQARRFSLRLR